MTKIRASKGFAYESRGRFDARIAMRAAKARRRLLLLVLDAATAQTMKGWKRK